MGPVFHTSFLVNGDALMFDRPKEAFEVEPRAGHRNRIYGYNCTVYGCVPYVAHSETFTVR